VGANVIVCALDEDGFEELVTAGVIAVKANVTKENEMQHVASVTTEKFGHIDMWINNAGIWLPHTPVEEVDWTRAHDLMEVNLFGTVYGSKVALILMRKQGYGSIVNILSTSALEGRATSSAYCASKFAANGFTKSLRKETEGSGIKVLSVFPGGIKTKLYDEKKPDNYNEYMEPSFVAEKIVENLKKEAPEEELIITASRTEPGF
jgi:NAD(P)-dependent dehydrogenase (short-subunit alcohol dehydrogenase family)